MDRMLCIGNRFEKKVFSCFTTRVIIDCRSEGRNGRVKTLFRSIKNDGQLKSTPCVNRKFY